MKYIIVVDKQPRTNPSSEKRETTIDIEELRRKGEIHDDFVIDRGIAKVYRRIGLTKTHMTYVLDNQVVEELGELKIKLFQGDNYIYIKDEYNNHLCAEFVIKNDFTDRYVTNLQMESAIEETASNIKLYVSQSLEGYSDTEQIKAMIELKANEIKEEVSRDYASKDALEQEKSERVQTSNSIVETVSATYSTKQETNTAKTEAINSANKSTDDKLKNYSTTTQMNSTITQKTDSITQTVTSLKESVEGSLQTNEQKIAKFEQNLDSIKQSVTAIQDNVSENVVNGDFKNDLNNWEVSSSGMMGVETINNKKWLYMGIYSYDVDDYISQKITTLMKDTQYRLSFDAYKQEDSDGAINASIGFYNSSNQLLSSKMAGFTFSDTEQNYNWEFNSPSGFEYAVLKFYNRGNPDKDMFIGNISIIGGALWQRVTQLQLSVDGVETEVRKKVGNDEVISKINQSAEDVRN